MPNSETTHFPYAVGDVIEIKADSLLTRRSTKNEDKLHVAAINYFDAIISSDEYLGKRFALVVGNGGECWADKIVITCPLSPCAVRRGWGTSSALFVIKPEEQITCGLEESYIVVPSRLSLQIHWIKRKLGSVTTEFLNSVPNEQIGSD